MALSNVLTQARARQSTLTVTATPAPAPRPSIQWSAHYNYLERAFAAQQQTALAARILSDLISTAAAGECGEAYEYIQGVSGEWYALRLAIAFDYNVTLFIDGVAHAPQAAIQALAAAL